MCIRDSIKRANIVNDKEHSIIPDPVFDPLNETNIDVDLNLVPNTSQSIDCMYAICNSFGFGGTNACIAISKFN